jgi:hypothetical protein
MPWNLQRNRAAFIFTTTPTADLTQPSESDPTYFAQLADGGGYTTSIILIISFYDNNGAPLAVSR